MQFYMQSTQSSGIALAPTLNCISPRIFFAPREEEIQPGFLLKKRIHTGTPGFLFPVPYLHTAVNRCRTHTVTSEHMHNLEDGEQSTNSDLDEAGEILVAAEDLLSQLESVKQMWYNAGFQGNFAEKVR